MAESGLPTPQSASESSDLGEDLVGRLGPNERFGVGVARVEVGADGIFEFLDAAMGSAPDRLVRQLPEPSFHLIEPRAVCRREVHHEPRVTLEPVGNQRCLVRAVVVEHHVDRKVGWNGRFDRLQELSELDGPMLLMLGRPRIASTTSVAAPTPGCVGVAVPRPRAEEAGIFRPKPSEAGGESRGAYSLSEHPTHLAFHLWPVRVRLVDG